MDLRWRDADIVELRDGYSVNDAAGKPVRVIENVRIAVEGGYLHIDVPGFGGIQMVGAPALGRAVRRAVHHDEKA